MKKKEKRWIYSLPSPPPSLAFSISFNTPLTRSSYSPWYCWRGRRRGEEASQFWTFRFVWTGFSTLRRGFQSVYTNFCPRHQSSHLLCIQRKKIRIRSDLRREGRGKETGTHVQREHLSEERRRNISRHDPLSKTFHHRSLSYSRFSNQAGVVLRPPAKHSDHSSDLGRRTKKVSLTRLSFLPLSFVLLTSASLPTTGSNFPSSACLVKSTQYFVKNSPGPPLDLSASFESTRFPARSVASASRRT